jgi:hypothetical protein
MSIQKWMVDLVLFLVNSVLGLVSGLGILTILLF